MYNICKAFQKSTYTKIIISNKNYIFVLAIVSKKNCADSVILISLEGHASNFAENIQTIE